MSTVLSVGALQPIGASPAIVAKSTEDALGSIWRTLLALESIGMNDNLLGLGANSLTAALACSQIEQDFGIHFSVIEVYRQPTIRALAARIDELVLIYASMVDGRTERRFALFL